MSRQQVMSAINRHAVPLAIIVTILLWVYVFRGFLLGEYTLIGDAVPYYDHIKFFVDNLIRGVYPLWDPTWEGGVSNEFFLRRMGESNPAFFLLAVVVKCGVPYMYAYLSLIATYYLVGAFGVYAIARRLGYSAVVSFVAYLLLAFSSVVTLLFNSFIVLTTTPMVWFFYFLLCFCVRPQKHTALGMSFMLMLLLSTYIPFYFLLIVLVGSACFACVYWRSVVPVITRSGAFFRRYPVFASIMVALVLASCVPAALFYHESRQERFVMPARNVGVADGNVLTVAPQNTYTGGSVSLNPLVVPDELRELMFNLRHFRLGVFYIPLFAGVLFMLSLIVSINKRMVFIALWGLVIYLISLYNATAFYTFLYEHVFFFRYFRNFQFFLWMSCLPLFVFIGVEHLDAFERLLERADISRRYLHAGMIVVHLVVLGYVVALYPLPSAYVTLVASYVFFTALINGWLTLGSAGSVALIVGISLVQPLEVYQYLSRNAERRVVPYYYDMPYQAFQFVNTRIPAPVGTPDEMKAVDALSAYYTTSEYHQMRQKIAQGVLNEYMRHRLVVYDRIRCVAVLDYPALSAALQQNRNEAFVSGSCEPRGDAEGSIPPDAFRVTSEADGIQIARYDGNTLAVRTRFAAKRFLVYNDAYHPGWEAFVSGKRVMLMRVNGAFKGVWVPAGEQIVVFRYGAWWLYAVKYFFAGLYGAVICWWVWLYRRRERRPEGALS